MHKGMIELGKGIEKMRHTFEQAKALGYGQRR